MLCKWTELDAPQALWIILELQCSLVFYPFIYSYSGLQNEWMLQKPYDQKKNFESVAKTEACLLGLNVIRAEVKIVSGQVLC